MNIDILEKIKNLTRNNFADGTLINSVLEKMVQISKTQNLEYTMETGCGRSSLVLSHLSNQHLIFAPDGRNTTAIHENQALLNTATSQFIVGPSLKHLPTYSFKHPLDLVLLDGAHAFPFPYVEYYYVYPHIRTGGWLIVDDIKIPTQYPLFDILRHDQLFELDEVIGNNTAFFKRTAVEAYDPFKESWPEQQYNKQYHPVDITRAVSGIYYA